MQIRGPGPQKEKVFTIRDGIVLLGDLFSNLGGQRKRESQSGRESGVGGYV